MFYTQTEYTLQDNLTRLNELVDVAANYGYKYLTIADSNNLHGAYKFSKKCKDNNIVPIIGINVTCILDNNVSNLLLYAKNQNGYLNIARLATILKITNRPLTINELEQHNSGVVAVTSGFDSELDLNIISGRKDSAYEVARLLTRVFENFYIGINKQSDLSISINDQLYRLSADLYIKTVITNNNKYLDYSEHKNYLILREISGHSANRDIDKFDLSFKPLKAITEAFDNITVENTFNLLNEFEFEFKKQINVLPKVNEYDSKQYLYNLCDKGLQRRLLGRLDFYNTYKKRLDYELSIISNMGYEEYFLIVWDFVKFAKNANINVGPGRGSAAGSLVAYVTGITNVDPIQYDLIFERFLNPERISMPDIDVDVPDEKRDEIISYIVNKYGNERVANIVTFNTYGFNSSIRDVAKVMNLTEKELNAVLDKEYDNNLNFKQQEVLRIAKSINGLPRHTSIHAAGIVMSSSNLLEVTPLQEGKADAYTTQFDAHDLEELGLLKIDLLGIRNLQTIKNIEDEIRKYINDFSINDVSLEDFNAKQLLTNANTLGIFQLESEGVRKVLNKLRIDTFDDLIATLALYRPGPMEIIDEYISRKHGKQYTFIHEDAIPYLKSTYGFIIYQEQIMMIANKLAGYTLGEADILRRAVSKKDIELLKKEETRFISGCITNGYSKQVSKQLYDYIYKFANYGFNKSHSVAYAMVAYQMAYLKANYKVLFYRELLNNSVISRGALVKLINETRSNGIDILKPCINESEVLFKTIKKKLIAPLTMINSISFRNANDIVAERNNKTFDSYNDFVSRCNFLSDIQLQNLVNAGVFDEIESTRKGLIDRNKEVTLFNQFIDIHSNSDIEEYSKEVLLEKEKESLGIVLSVNIHKELISFVKKNNYKTVSDIVNITKGTFSNVFMVVEDFREHNSKNGVMCFLKATDNISSIDSVIFSDLYCDLRGNINKGSKILVDGKMNLRNNSLNFVISDIRKIWK